jgi:hypothetical protein
MALKLSTLISFINTAQQGAAADVARRSEKMSKYFSLFESKMLFGRSRSTRLSAKPLGFNLKGLFMRRVSIGKCNNCGIKLEKNEMINHIQKCAKTTDNQGVEGLIIQLLIEADKMPEYWLLVEGINKATFQQLDSCLRKIWLECCDHLSRFYEMRNQISKQTTFVDYFTKPGITFKYKYDFKSTTALMGKSIYLRKGSIGKNIRLLAQNLPLVLNCSECNKPAVIVCPYCIDVKPTLFCAYHAEKHRCSSKETFLPVVNSPRMGICKYIGQ